MKHAIKNKIKMCLLIYCVMFVITVAGGCKAEEASPDTLSEDTVTITETTVAHRTISAEKAKEMMDAMEDYVIVDVRTQDEYDSGYIEGAILIPHTQMRNQAPEMLADKDQTILIYCRSGRRSAYAAEVLSSMGYTHVYDFGGIIDWPYEVIRDD